MIGLKRIVLLALCVSSYLAQAQTQLPADPRATAATRNLYHHLQQLQHTAVLFGHQDDLAYGVGWAYEPGRSDVQSATGAYPAVYGWELGYLELDSTRNLDQVPFKKIQAYMREVYKRGGINTISWHLNNPVNGLTAWDTTRNTVRAMLPGGAQHATFVAYLSRLADFMQAAQASWFKPIPIIFRPFHENTGSWFWWGKKQCTPDEYKALFRFTVDYLRRERRVHNLLIAYSPAEFDSQADFMTRYPGDEYVDIIGFDAYYRGDGSAFRADMDRQLPALLALATAHHKVAALTETGFDQIPEPEWWTKTLLPYLQQYPLAYVLVWRNGPTGHYFAPSPGQVSTQDFQAFYRAPKVLFQDKLTPLRVYKKR